MGKGTASNFPGWYVTFQVALLQQAPRPGEIDQNTAEGWTSNQEALKGVLAKGLLPPPEPVVDEITPVEKFTLLADLGVIVVPDGYVHSTRLDLFKEENGGKFYYYDGDINDENFANATVQLQPGRRLRVKAFKQAVPGRTTSEERLAFIQDQNGILTGAQGASLVWEQKRDQLPKGYWYCSFDEKKALPLIDGFHGVPYVLRHSGGDYVFDLGNFENDWDDDNCVLVFCDEKPLGA